MIEKKWNVKYRMLEGGEIIKRGDEVDCCRDGWRDWPDWVPAVHTIGKAASDPKYPSHSRYRRLIDKDAA